MTFADNFNIRSSQLSGNNIASALDGLLVSSAFDQWSSSNTASASLGNVSGASTSITTASGELLIIVVQINLSHSSAGSKVQYTINLDSSDVVTAEWTAHANNVNGNEGTSVLTWLSQAPSVGAHTLKVRWSTPGPTAYTTGGTMWALALQTT